MIRALAFYTGQALATLVFGPLCPLLHFFPYHYRHGFIRQWSRFNLWWLWQTCRLGYTVEGRLPKAPGVIACKHQSAWETIALQALLPAHAFVLKRELLWIPLFGWGLMALEYIAINRGATGQALRSVLAQGRVRLARHRWVVIFPEGTRQQPGSRGHYHPTAAVLAIESGRPLVPIAHNAGYHWPRKALIKKPGTIHLVIGDPIPSTGKSPRQLSAEAENWIEATCATLPPVGAAHRPHQRAPTRTHLG